MIRHHLSIDIETFSSVDLIKSGLYKYVQSPDFEVLLFAYSLDDTPVCVVDLTAGEEIPPDIIHHLFSNTTAKHAYNAPFEWYCLSKHFRLPEPCFGQAIFTRDKWLSQWLPQWHCTMMHGLYCGYTAGLDATGKAMGLPSDARKLQTGRALIRYFCTPCAPTKNNGGRTRNLPHHDPDKWQLFKTYCGQDVVAEMEIQRRLQRFPVPDFVQSQWITDQRINARGVAVDSDFVDNALYIGETVRQALTKEATQISGLDNPNSVAQLTKWLEEEIDEEISDLRKDTVKELLDRGVNGEAATRMLELRQELGRTSTKKYDAIETCMCADGRVRGLLQFYGANRTGRWCLTGDHEVLTPMGWVRLDRWAGGEIACWSPQTEFISFQTANALAFDYEGEMIAVSGQRCEQICTPDHKMPFLQKDGSWGSDTMAQVSRRRFTIPFTGRRLIGQSHEPDKLRVLIMTQADGHYTHEGDIRLHFKKQRKVERCKHLLRKCQIAFIEQKRANGTVCITVKSRWLPLWLRQFQDKTFGYWMLDESADVIFDELPYWDGYACGPNSIQYTTTNKQNAEVIQAAAALSGRSATQLIKHRSEDAWNDAYIVNIWNTPGRGTAIRSEQVSKTFHAGKVYCAETKTGFFMVRRNGKVWITGNSGRQVQVQNLPRTYIEPLPLARRLVKERQIDALRFVYGSVPDTLSQLIRTALVAAPGHMLIDADFSAIEARVIAWLAGEQWVLDVFRTHGKIYEATASQMFGIALDLIKKGNPEYSYRQKGKVATLALGYQGGTNALINMGALAQGSGITEDELPGIRDRWRKANPRIVGLWYAVGDAALQAVQTGRPVSVRGLTFARECDPQNGQDFLTILLPSGRKLYYVRPHMGTNRFGEPSLAYWGMNQVSKRWEAVETYGGKLVENCVQAIARDCLAESIEHLEAAGYAVVFHVHDEVVIEAPAGAASLEDVVAIMRNPPTWAPDLPLNADGWVNEFFKKD